MSGFLGQALGAASLIGQLAGAGGVTIGGVALATFEIPERMPFGGEQSLVEHRLPGGAKVVDAMGAFDVDYSWSGIFQGPAAVSRAQQIDALRVAGKPIPLTFGGQFYQLVLIKSFTPSYERDGYWFPYSITCTVVPSTAPAGAPSLLQQATNDIGDAVGIPNLTGVISGGVATAQAAVAQVQSVLPLAGVLTGGSAAFQSVSSAVATASGAIGAAQGIANGVLSAARVAGVAAGTLLGSVSNGAAAAVSTLSSVTAAAGQAGGLAAMVGYVGRTATNLVNAL